MKTSLRFIEFPQILLLSSSEAIMRWRTLIVCTIVFFEFLLASCANRPTTPAVPTAEESFSKGLWSLATQNRPIALADLSEALDLKADDYENSLPSTNAWESGLLLKEAIRNEPGKNMVRAVSLSKVESYSPYRPATEKPAKPRTQVVEIVLQAPFCIDGEAVGKSIGVDVKREFHPGYADVTPATFNVISHESDHADGKIFIGVGCMRFVTVRLAFTE